LSPEVPLPSLIGALAAAFVGALFAWGDTALTSLKATRIAALLDQSEGATKDALERIHRQGEKLHSRYLLGRVAGNAATAVFLYQAFVTLAPAYAVLLSLGGTVFATGMLFEIATAIARRHPESAAPAAVRFLRPLEIAMLPLSLPFALVGSRVARKEVEEGPDPAISAEVEILVGEGEKSGLFAHEPAEMIRNVLEFSERTARDVMIPRAKVEAIEVSTEIERAKRLVSEVGHSRYPVYKEQLDNVVGLLYAKDLFKTIGHGEDGAPRSGPLKSLREVLRSPANFVAESQPLASLLKDMRSRRQHLAIVVDELGAVSGIVTLEDVLEEIVGDIRDEHDEIGDDATIEDLGGGLLVADAAVSITDLSNYLKTDLGADHKDDSLGGMLTHHFGKVPEAGTALNKFGLEFIVRDCNDHQIGKVEIRSQLPEQPEGSRT
jgi:putative hemolysin